MLNHVCSTKYQILVTQIFFSRPFQGYIKVFTCLKHEKGFFENGQKLSCRKEKKAKQLIDWVHKFVDQKLKYLKGFELAQSVLVLTFASIFIA